MKKQKVRLSKVNDLDELHTLEKETKLEIIRLEEACDDENNKHMVHHVGELLEKYFNEVRVFFEKHKDNENINAFVKKVKEDTKCIVDKTKDKLEDVKSDDKTQELLTVISNKVNFLVDSLRENETLDKIKESVIHTYESVKNDPYLKEKVGKLRNATLKVTQKALTKVEEKLSQDDEIKIHEVKED